LTYQLSHPKKNLTLINPQNLEIGLNGWHGRCALNIPALFITWSTGEITGFILGDLDFENWIKGTLLSGRRDEKEIPQLKKLKPRVQLESIVNSVCEEFGCEKGQIITKGHKKNKARQVAIHVARDLSGVSCKDLGIYFGGVSGALITMMHNRISDETKRNRRLKRKINEIKNRIFNI